MWRKKISGTFTDIAMANRRQGCILNPAFDSTTYSWDICGKPATVSPQYYDLKIIKAGPSDTATWDCIDIGANKTSDPVQVKVQGTHIHDIIFAWTITSHASYLTQSKNISVRQTAEF
jgi:hypothetical protein